MINKQVAQMIAHGVNVKRYPYASFVAGRGWKGHKTIRAAKMAAKRDAARISKPAPQWIVSDTAGNYNW